MIASDFIRSNRVDFCGIGAIALLALLGWDVIFWDVTTVQFERVNAVESFLYDPGGGGHLAGLAVAGWMIWRRRAQFAAETIATHPIVIGFLIPAFTGTVLIRGWAAHTGAVDLQIAALASIILLGGSLLAGGRGLAWMLGPACVCILAMPIPIAIVNAVLYPMQLLTAQGVSMQLEFLEVPHRLMGEQIFTRAHAFYVIEGCAGLRSLQTLALAAALYLELSFRNLRQVILVMAAVPFVAVVVNQLRVLSIVLRPSSGLSGDHDLQGIAMICLGVVVISSIDSLIRKLEKSNKGMDIGPPIDRVTELGTRSTAVLTIQIVVLAGLYMLAGSLTPRWEVPLAPTPRAADLPIRIGEWQAVRTLELDRDFLGSVTWSDWVHRRYESSAGVVELLLLGDDHRHRHQNVISTKTVLARPGFRIVSRDWITTATGDRRVERVRLDGVTGRFAVLHWRIAVATPVEEYARAILALDQSVYHREERTFVVRLATAVSDDPAESQRKEETLLRMAALVDLALLESGLAHERIFDAAGG